MELRLIDLLWSKVYVCSDSLKLSDMMQHSRRYNEMFVSEKFANVTGRLSSISERCKHDLAYRNATVG